MEELHLFEALEVPAPEPTLAPHKKKTLPPDTDAEFWKDLESWKPLCSTVEKEIIFLGDYLERFGFEGDRKRLNTLKHYLHVYEEQD